MEQRSSKRAGRWEMSDYWQMKVTLEFGGKEYIFEDSNYSDGAGCFWWEEGN